MVRIFILLLLSAIVANAQVGEIRQVTESWENGGKNTVVGELLTILSVSNGYRYERSDGSIIWSNPDQYATKTILYGTVPPDDGTDTGSGGGDSNGTTGGTTTTTTTTDGDVTVTVNVTTPEVNIPEVDLTEITSLISQLDTNDDYDELVAIVGALENNYAYLTTEQKEKLVEVNNKLIEIRDNLTSDLNDLKTKSQKNLDYLAELNSTYLELDRDNDVPMLTQIYDELEILEEKNNENLTNIYVRQEEIAGEISDRETELLRMTQFADIENSLRIIETEVREQRGTLIDENGSERLATLADIVNAITGENNESNLTEVNTSELSDTFAEMEGKALTYINSMSALPTEGGAKLNTLFSMSAGSKDFYLDPINNVYSGGIDLGVTWDDVANWVQLVIGFAFLIIYFQAQLYHVARVLDLIIQAPASSPATTIPQIAVKVTLYGLLIGSAVWGGVLTIWEADMSVFGATGTVFDIFGNIDDLIAGNGWGSMAISLMFDLVPVAILVYYATLYWISRAVVQFINVSGFTILKMSS